MIIKKHTRNQKRMYRIHKMEEQIQMYEDVLGTKMQEIEKLKKIIEQKDDTIYKAKKYLMDQCESLDFKADTKVLCLMTVLILDKG